MFPPLVTRREMLQTVGGGLGGLMLADVLRETALGRPLPTHFTPRAKHVIFLFMGGGPSHLDLFDPKPEIAKRAGQRPQDVQLRTERVTAGLLPSPFKFKAHGASGIEVSELLPKLSTCVDDLCVVRSLHGVKRRITFSAPIDQIHSASYLDRSVSVARRVGVVRFGHENDALPASFRSRMATRLRVMCGTVICPVKIKRRPSTHGPT